MYIACICFAKNPKVNVYLLADFLTGNPVGDYVARQHTRNVMHYQKTKIIQKQRADIPILMRNDD